MIGSDLLSRLGLSMPSAAATSAGTDVTGTGVDMSGYDGVVFITRIATANAGNYLKAEQSQELSANYSALTGSKAAAGSNGDIVTVDVHRPVERYVRPVIVRGGANTATDAIYAIRYRGAKAPISQSGVVRVILNGPSEGTP